ncbi:MAG: hypothetical protein U9N77_02920 [Thermodesulfobacteriota bacterium]|nr:hypothetical protein [Thermodesulfobacteriota bacterium]
MIINSYAEFHITATGSLGGLSLHTTNDESYTPGLPGLSYKPARPERGIRIGHNKI